ncbi:MAG: hypothetical protein CMD16_01885 [Flavobacteriales bacterium]|nr:hypothetical protein [Flavobacteriales bacterium]|tara:strand:- start:14943 stop:15647 length:705 start_codon:yes stop_codon:yes gene_type:complete
MKNRFLLLILFFFILNAKSQDTRTKFGLQYKPIIPAAYFNSAKIIKESGDYKFKLDPKYSNSFGMIVRHRINKTFFLESGLNYIERNFKLSITNSNINLTDFTTFGMRSYELPVQLLTYVQIKKYWYLNVAFGVSYNILASDILSYGETKYYTQNTIRKNGGYEALLANIGMEYRTENKGDYYFGTSLHRPWKAIGKIYPEFSNNTSLFNETQNFSLDMLGNFLTIDFRYFFAE